MSTKEKEKTQADAEDGEATGGKKKLFLILAVVLVAAGAGAWFFLFAGSSAKASAPTPGTVVALDPVAVNLAGGGYLKVGVALQLTSGAPDAKPEGSKAIDLIISTFSQASPADVNGSRDALKTTLQQKIIKAYGADEVMGIYYTNYVTQ